MTDEQWESVQKWAETNPLVYCIAFIGGVYSSLSGFGNELSISSKMILIVIGIILDSIGLFGIFFIITTKKMVRLGRKECEKELDEDD